MADIALRVCPKIQMSIDKNDPTIPTAAREATLSTLILPTTAASVLDKTGSAIPATIAGTASCWIRLKEISMVEII